MKKLNIAELLKDCPSGMELNCTICDNVYFDEVTPGMIKCFVKNDVYNTIYFHHDGTYFPAQSAKCVIFPKGKTTWEGFQRPFKNGDVVATTNGTWIGITLGGKAGNLIPTYCVIDSDNEFSIYFDRKEEWAFNRLATEEEKQKLFDAIKANGYKWNAETKTLEKLVEPKFKVGDRIRHKTTNKNDIYEISKVYDDSYGLVDFTWMVYMKYQDDYELVPNKFDITTLKPFDKVLIRDNEVRPWNIGFFSFKKDEYFMTSRGYYAQCIPYEENKHLLGTTNDCDEYFKN